MRKNRHLLAFLKLTSIFLLFTGCVEDGNVKSFTGIIEGETHTIASPVSDKLIDLKVGEGDWVSRGDFLGRIDTTILSLQVKRLKANLKQIELQEKDPRLNLMKINPEILKSQAEGLQYQIDMVKENIGKADLIASTAGYVDKIYFEKDEYVPPLRPILDLVNLDKVWCYIYVSEEMLSSIKPGDSVTGKTGGNTFSGRVRHINSRAEFSPKEILTPDNRKALVYAVKIFFQNTESILKTGMPVDVYLDKIKDE